MRVGRTQRAARGQPLGHDRQRHQTYSSGSSRGGQTARNASSAAHTPQHQHATQPAAQLEPAPAALGPGAARTRPLRAPPAGAASVLGHDARLRHHRGRHARPVVAPVQRPDRNSRLPRRGSRRRSKTISAAAAPCPSAARRSSATSRGGTSLRLRDIVVRDADGTVVASAPKAEVGISGASLFSGKVRAQSLNLVGAEMRVRIETDGKVTVFAGADQRPIATAAPAATASGGRARQQRAGATARGLCRSCRGARLDRRPRRHRARRPRSA